jgi:hypothetical protein
MDFGLRQYHRELLGRDGPDQVQDLPGARDGIVEKELQPRKVHAKGTSRQATLLLQIAEIVAELLFGEFVWGFVIVFGQHPHGAQVAILGILREPV